MRTFKFSESTKQYVAATVVGDSKQLIVGNTWVVVTRTNRARGALSQHAPQHFDRGNTKRFDFIVGGASLRAKIVGARRACTIFGEV